MLDGALALAHEALASSAHERNRLGEKHAHRIAERDRLRVRRALDRHPLQRGGGEIHRSVERQRRKLLALRFLHRLGLLLGELAETTQEILGISPERKTEAATFHALRVTNRV